MAAPFRWKDTPYFDFGKESVIRNLFEILPNMAKLRLVPPPKEVYAIHRKIVGVYLTCIKLKARVPARRLFEETYEIWKKNLKKE